MWAAKSSTETCYLTYADQPSGLGPEGILFVSSGVQWMNAMEEWRKHDGRGPVPGLGRKKPVIIPYHELETKYEKHIRMDYWIRAGAYLLRPEVSQQFLEDF